jgi:hypothetical protein
MSFMRAPESGLNIPPPRLAHILTEAAAVYGPRGLIRPIVLNMVGLVLARIAESPQAGLPTPTLLANDLRAHINQRERRRISRIILPEMLTDADTKSPKSIGELKTATGLEPRLILGFLQDLELAGYVRQISHAPNIADRIWEISHDFVARLLGPIVRRRFETLREKIFKVMYLAFVAAWVLVLGTLFIAAPWLSRQRAEEILRDRFSMYLHDQGDGYLASEQSSNFTDLPGAVDELVNFGSITELNLTNCLRLTNVDGLKGLTALHSLNLTSCLRLTNVDGLKGLTALQSLNLSHCSQLTNVDGLKGLTALQSLNLSGCYRLTNLDGLKGLPALRDLDLTRSSISPDEIAAFKRALPSTDIRH